MSLNTDENEDKRNKTLFVGNLPYFSEEQSLQDLFGKYNPADISIIRNDEGYSRGFGFVELPSYDEACRALNEMTGVCISGRRLRIEFSNDNGSYENEECSCKTLFIGNIPFSATEQNLSDLFGKFKALDIRIKRDRKGYSRGFGYVELPSYNVACRALSQMQGVCISGRQLRIELSDTENPDNGGGDGSGDGSWNGDEGEGEGSSDGGGGGGGGNNSGGSDGGNGSGRGEGGGRRGRRRRRGRGGGGRGGGRYYEGGNEEGNEGGNDYDGDDLDDGDDTDNDYQWYYRHGFYSHFDPNVVPSWRNMRDHPRRYGIYSGGGVYDDEDEVDG